MPSRLGPRSSSSVVQQMPRQVKKVSVPVVPDVACRTHQWGTCQDIIEAMTAGAFCQLDHSVVLKQKSEKYKRSTKSSLPDMLQVPSTSMVASVVPPDLSASNDYLHSVRSLFSRRKDLLYCLIMRAFSSTLPSSSFSYWFHLNFIVSYLVKEGGGGELLVLIGCSTHRGLNLEEDHPDSLIGASPSSSVSMKQQSFYVDGRSSDDLSYRGYHRNSAGSSSSHGSSSGFESMKSGFSSGCSARDTQSAVNNDPSFLGTSSTVCGLSSGLLLPYSQSRLSMESDGNGVASLIINNVVDRFNYPEAEHIHEDNSTDISRLSLSDMLLKGMPEAEVLALWLDSLGYPEYLTPFLIQGYDLSTIARITPEDLTALGITHPAHRKLLISEIHRWHITDRWPSLVPSGELREWLLLIGLPEYVTLFETQGYSIIEEIKNFTWEDFEDMGIKKLGHLKRLGLAIRKLKAACDGLHSHLVPSLPALGSIFCPTRSGNSCDHYYSTWRQNQHFCDIVSSEAYSQKQTVEVYPHYQPTLANKMVAYDLQKCGQQLLEDNFSKQKNSPKMNLYSDSRILSDGNSQKQSVVQQLSLFPANILNAVDNSISSDSEDYPPPPVDFIVSAFETVSAPLVCEGSIQFLRSAFHESTIATTTDLDTSDCGNFVQYYSGTCALPLNEPLPFANDNCGAMKSSIDLPLECKCDGKSTNNSFSQPNTLRRCNHHFFVDNVEFSSYSVSASNGDVLNDIGSMLQNLTDELDAMLLPSHSVQ
uniref:SAM domain-containing protein n=1 Tax=Setaria digitata TaxID=48799 RepID=A0A915PIH7_9BILA